jgi:hypothetical protein
MMYRRLDSNRDYPLGHGSADHLRDTPETVAQAVVTRLAQLAGEWFLDLQDGTPYVQGVFGRHTQASYDLVLQSRILGTEGVTEILSYESDFDPDTRRLTVSVSIDTVYGPATATEVL